MTRTLVKKIFIIVILLLTLGLGVVITRWFYHKTEKVEKEDASVLLERIRNVAKLVTVEGYFSEIYDYQDYYGYDLSIFRKKALVRVKAKVSVGYDLEKMKIDAYPERKTIVISRIPPVELLSIEHDLDYYDVQEGIFNSFTTEDYNRLNAKAKEFIRQRAMESDLLLEAATQKNLWLETIRFITESTGWKLEIQGMEETEMPESFGN